MTALDEGMRDRMSDCLSPLNALALHASVHANGKLGDGARKRGRERGREKSLNHLASVCDLTRPSLLEAILIEESRSVFPSRLGDLEPEPQNRLSKRNARFQR